MDTFHMRVFQLHVLDQCQFVLAAGRDINLGLAQLNTDNVFGGIQSLLNASANVSKLLWGQGGKHTEARRHLRESIGIGDDSPLREVSMRNNFEHMDERIDRWWAQSTHHGLADKLIGPRSMIEGIQPIDSFRWFDPASKEIIFWGQGFNIQSLVTEVERLLPKLREQASKPHWDAVGAG